MLDIFIILSVKYQKIVAGYNFSQQIYSNVMFYSTLFFFNSKTII